MKLIEARRYVLLADAPLEAVVPGARKWATAAGEYTLPRGEWLAALQSLRGKAKTDTLALAAAHLPRISYRPAARPFRRVAMPRAWQGAAILFLSPNLRRWRRVLQNGGVIWIRPDWCVLVKRGNARGEYFVTTDGPVTTWPARALNALMAGYAGVIGELVLPVSVSDGVAVVPRWHLVLPPAHADWLRRMCLVSEPPDEVWLWDSADLPLIETVLRQLQIRLDRTAREAVSTLPFAEFLAALGAGYASALATEDDVEQFARKVKTCDLEGFAETKMREPLSRLMSRAFRGDPAARSLLDYLGDRVAISWDWREGGDLRTVVLTSAARRFAGHEGERFEHLLAIPGLETWATARTTVLSADEAGAHPHAAFSHYRVLPFFGRLRVTPGNKIGTLGDPARDEDVWRSLLSLPAFEQEMSPATHPFAFSVAFLPWAAAEPGQAGAIVLERLIGSAAKVLRRNPSELDLPGLLCEDAAGTRFVLETRLLRQDDVPAAGSLFRFVARRVEGAGRPAVPIYELVMPWFAGAVDEDTYWAAAATAAVKVHLRLEPARVKKLVCADAAAALDAAVARGWLRARGRGYVFRYVELSDEDCDDLWGNRRPKSAHGRIVERLRPRIHPLFGWVFGIRASGRAEAVHLSAGPPQMEQAISEALDANGHAFVAALGRDRLTLVLAVRRLAANRDDLGYERSDDAVKRSGEDVPRTQYRIAKIRA